MRHPCEDCALHKELVRKQTVHRGRRGKDSPECIKCIREGKVHNYMLALNEDPLVRKFPSDRCGISSSSSVSGFGHFGQVEMI